MSAMTACPTHGHPLPPVCPACVEMIKRPVESMTNDERAEELMGLRRCLTVDFSDLHKRVEELVGRPVWTHEFAVFDRLVEEARTQRHPVDLEAHVIGSLDQLTGNRPVHVFRPTRDPR